MPDSTKFNAFPEREWTASQVAKYFGRHADSMKASELYKQDKPAYDRMRALAVSDGLVAAKPEWSSPSIRDRWNPKPLTEEQIRLRATVSEAEVRGYYTSQSDGNHNNLSRLATADPDRYRLVKSAAIAWNIIPEQPMPRVPEPRAPEHSTMLTLSDEHCDRIGEKRGLQVDEEQYLRIVTTINEVDEQRAKAAAQAAKDAVNDSSVATFGRVVRETPSERAAAVERRAVVAVEEGLAKHDAAKSAA
jgi:hypothetical protein